MPQNVSGPFGLTNAVAEYALFCAGATLLLNGLAIFRLRVWNPSREAAPRNENETPIATDGTRDVHAAPAQPARSGITRFVARNADLGVWKAYFIGQIRLRRAVRGRCSGDPLAIWRNRRVTRGLRRDHGAVVRAEFDLDQRPGGQRDRQRARSGFARSRCSVTDLSPKEFIFGKLGGIFYGAKEMLVLPHLLIAGMWAAGIARGDEAFYLSGGLLALQAFVAMLGVHIGLAYDNSRQAIAVSLGIVFFLLVGVGTCMRIMIAFSHSSLAIQLVAFSAVILCGSLLLYAALGVRNPSGALLTASLICPIATFAGIMQFLGGDTFSVFVVVVGTYGLATAAMMVPAIDAFDVATGRTTE
ncbi:MAG: hypothetical protein QM811_15385 [Pirellulales bacterium]